MDYLDPQKKKIKKLRLMIGYALLAIAISMATLILVFLTNGYYVDRQSGEVIQNGLIYIDSRPETAQVFLNGEKQRGTTDARLVVPEAKYDIELQREGYHNWNKSIQLEGGTLRRLTYARLIPTQIDSEAALELPEKPTFYSQSIDKRWVVMAFPNTPLLMRMIDLEREDLQLEDIPIPVGLVDTTKKGVWEVIDWADNNRSFLASYTVESSVEYVIIDRVAPDLSVNLTDRFPTTTYTSAFLRNRKNDKVFLHDAGTKTLWRADIGSGAVELAKDNVIQFKPFGDDAILYITPSEDKTKVDAILSVGVEEYKLRQFAANDSYLLDISKIANAYVVGVSAVSENRVVVFYDPIKAVELVESKTLPVPTTVLRIDSPKFMSISSDSSVIVARNGSNFASHEFEDDRTYRFDFGMPVDDNQRLHWVDGQHFTISAQGKQYISDFDGANQHELHPSDVLFGGFMDSALDEFYTLQTVEQPDNTPRFVLNRSFMRTASDR